VNHSPALTATSSHFSTRYLNYEISLTASYSKCYRLLKHYYPPHKPRLERSKFYGLNPIPNGIDGTKITDLLNGKKRSTQPHPPVPLVPKSWKKDCKKILPSGKQQVPSLTGHGSYRVTITAPPSPLRGLYVCTAVQTMSLGYFPLSGQL